MIHCKCKNRGIESTGISELIFGRELIQAIPLDKGKDQRCFSVFLPLLHADSFCVRMYRNP